MRKILYANPENISAIARELSLQAAVIGRFDDYMSNDNNVQQLIVETLHGTHVRCYVAEYEGINFLIVYGRFDRVRSTAADIDFRLTQEAISFLEIPSVIGTFVVGSIKPETAAGTIYIPDDFVGMGGYNQTMAGNGGFRNVDMFQPFCQPLREALIDGARTAEMNINAWGTYVCFHGYPRIETQAELTFFACNGWDIVGQTLDPEATLARESGCHYSALAVTIDDSILRSRLMQRDLSARSEIDEHIVDGRRRMWKIFLGSLPSIKSVQGSHCCCLEQGRHFSERSKHFYYRPQSFFD